jgi:hypothetical protein
VPEDQSVQQATLEALHDRLDKLEAWMNDLDRNRALFRNLGWAKLGLSAFTAFILGFFAPILAVAAVVDAPLPGIAWLIGVGAGAMNMARDVRAQLDLPPVPSNGGIPLPAKKGGAS